jgi:hypothetical protein
MATKQTKTIRSSKKSSRSFSNKSFIFMTAIVFGVVGSVMTFTSFAARATCIPDQPVARFQNTYKWASWGTNAKAGERVGYLASVTNFDQNCGTSTFNITVTAPDGFLVENAIQTVTLDSGTNRDYSTINKDFEVYITSPAGLGDGDYPITITATKQDGTTNKSATDATSYYKVYSVDTTAPTMMWKSDLNGKTVSVSDRTLQISHNSTDNKRVKQVQILIDGSVVASRDCTTHVGYSCDTRYDLDLRKNKGVHNLVLSATDFSGNTLKNEQTFTVQ